jgi:hypothetical protein
MVHMDEQRSVGLPQRAVTAESLQEGVRGVSDALARRVIQALSQAECIGIALLRSPDWAHVFSSATYDRLVGVSAHAEPASEVFPERFGSRALLERVVATGKAARWEDVLERLPGRVGGPPVSAHVSFSFLRVRDVTPAGDGVLVVVQDVSQAVHEHRIAELFVALASDMTAERDESESIRSSVMRASEALGADAASIFLLSADGTRLCGALVGWDWTRTSFVAEVEHWPNVARAIARNEAVYVTAESAQLAEEVWFERRGIKGTVCAPMMAHGRVLGVLFFDYVTPKPAQVDVRVAMEIAAQCALLVARAEQRGAAGEGVAHGPASRVAPASR